MKDTKIQSLKIDTKIQGNKFNHQVQVLGIGGYGKLVANMTAIIYDKKIILIDSGKGFEIEDKSKNLTPKGLSLNKPSQPNFSYLNNYIKNGYVIEALIMTHCHGDHMGGFYELFRFLQNYGIEKSELTIYTSEFAQNLASRTVQGWPKDQVRILHDHSSTSLDDQNNFFSFYLNHSSLHSVALYFKIKNKKILFLPDHRIDYSTKLGPNQKTIDDTLDRIDKESPDLVILEGTQVSTEKSYIPNCESSACANLKNMICYEANKQGAETIIVSTYSTNPERLNSILDAAKEVGRKILILGRGMENGYSAAKASNLLPLDLSHVITKGEVSMINKEKTKYVVLTTGHMGEHNASLSKMLRGELPFTWSKNDCIILASKTIPKEGPHLCRAYLKAYILSKRVPFYDADSYPLIHSGGHLVFRDYVRYFLKLKQTKKFVINHYDRDEGVGIYRALEEACKKRKMDTYNKVKLLEENQSFYL